MNIPQYETRILQQESWRGLKKIPEQTLILLLVAIQQPSVLANNLLLHMIFDFDFIFSKNADIDIFAK